MKFTRQLYKVDFGILEDDTKFFNIDHKTVLASSVKLAIKVATHLLKEEHKKTYFVQSVELLFYAIDNN